MKKEYATPDFEVVLLRFEAMMDQMKDSKPEDSGEEFDDDWE